MKPSVGRIVRYRINYAAGLGETAPKDHAAIITAVYGDHVSLTVFTEVGPITRDGIPFSEEPRASFWSWPPRD